ncbi:MAG: amino acid permease [Gammaproteobacteria bacterium]|nr:amino acid permease [Gammaproteobacteria bacterium]
MGIFRTKPITGGGTGAGLRRCLSTADLVFLGIGGIIGAGIFVLTGVAAATEAGPAIVVSFLVSGLACAFTALSYAELAAAIGGSGSAYGYAYAGLGEIIAWIVGWDLVLEYGVATAAVAIGWSGYVRDALLAVGVRLPQAVSRVNYDAVWALMLRLARQPVPAAVARAAHAGGFINAPAALVVLALSGVLMAGVRQSATANAVMVVIKLAVIGVFIGVAALHVTPGNWHPFMPFGWPGIMRGAAIIFFAYIGFDAVSTAAEETRDPQRSLPIGIIASLVVCTAIYIAVSGLLTGIVPYFTLNNASPVAESMLILGYPKVALLVGLGAIVGLTSVMLVLFYGLTRIFLAMSRDGLLPPFFAAVHPRTQTPVRVIALCGAGMALIAGFTPIGDVAELVNIGTLAAFAIVCGGVLVLRVTRPDLPRPFRVPASPFVPVLGMVFCLYLMTSLPVVTWIRYIVWLIIGLAVYLGYGRQHSALAPEPGPPLAR